MNLAKDDEWQVEDSEVIEDIEDSDVWEEEPEPIPVPQTASPAANKPPEAEELPEGLMENLDLMDRALEGKTDVFASKVVQLVMKLKISPNDPIFLVLLAMGELELMMVDLPMLIEELYQEHEARLRNLFSKYFGANDSEVRQRYEVSLAGIKHEIASAVTELIRTTRNEQLKGDLLRLAKLMTPALAIVLGSVGLGVFGTLQYHQLKTDTLLGTGKLTPEQYGDLQWAQSKEGKQARKIMELNTGYVGKTCKADAEAMGLRLNFGERTVTSGFCVLFVEPPDKRKYE